MADSIHSRSRLELRDVPPTLDELAEIEAQGRGALAVMLVALPVGEVALVAHLLRGDTWEWRGHRVSATGSPAAAWAELLEKAAETEDRWVPAGGTAVDHLRVQQVGSTSVCVGAPLVCGRHVGGDSWVTIEQMRAAVEAVAGGAQLPAVLSDATLVSERGAGVWVSAERPADDPADPAAGPGLLSGVLEVVGAVGRSGASGVQARAAGSGVLVTWSFGQWSARTWVGARQIVAGGGDTPEGWPQRWEFLGVDERGRCVGQLAGGIAFTAERLA